MLAKKFERITGLHSILDTIWSFFCARSSDDPGYFQFDGFIQFLYHFANFRQQYLDMSFVIAFLFTKKFSANFSPSSLQQLSSLKQRQDHRAQKQMLKHSNLFITSNSKLNYSAYTSEYHFQLLSTSLYFSIISIYHHFVLSLNPVPHIAGRKYMLVPVNLALHNFFNLVINQNGR